MGHYIAITCEALARNIYAAAAQTPHTITIRLFKQGLHNRPKNLREVLQAEIDTIEPGSCDAILLVYGICGTSTIGLKTQHTPLVIPRAHDCITLYLGSKERYQAEFDQHPGTYWYSLDYMERAESDASVGLGAAGIEEQEEQYEKYVKKYGKKKADILMEEIRKWTSHYTRAAFIDMGLGNAAPYEQMAQNKAQKEGWEFESIKGNRILLEKLIQGDWSPEAFLQVPPGHSIQHHYDDGLIYAKPET